ncbi:hypothetical protein [Rhodococcus zopfii]|uniref:hypothetical protein n=1 Tax=Rhodococcus zopfii TaxID=43772 RepID=UPI0009355172|nr:hypothetical protein [Rhodococcus zopfii]
MAPTRPEDVLELYVPRGDPDWWEEIAPFVRDVVRRGFEPSPVAQVVRGRIWKVTSLVRWALEQGLPLDVEQIFHPATVNRYALTVAGLSDATRCTRRATLTGLSRRITRVAPWEPPRVVLHNPCTANPYTPAQVARLLWWAPRQTTELRRRTLAAAVALGAGCGLRGIEMMTVRASDVRVRGDHVIVTVTGPRARQVPVRPQYAAAVLAAVDRAAGGHLFRDPVPGSAQGAAQALDECEVPATLMPVTTSRLRWTWECAMIQRVPLPVFMAMSGRTDTHRLADVLAGARPRSRPWWTTAELATLAEAEPW